MFRLKMTRCCLLIFEIIIENIEVVIRVTLTLFYVLPIILSFCSQPFSSPDSPCSFSVVLPINLLLLLYIHWHRVNKQAVKVFSSHHSMKCQLNRCFDEGPSSSASLHSFIYGNISEAVSRFSHHFSVFFKSKHICRSLILYSDHSQF